MPDPAVEYKSVPVGGVQTIDEGTGIVEAIVSVTGVKDRVNDIIQPGSYQKTLAARKPKGVWCVDTETEILTARGWLRHDEVRVGDLAYSLNGTFDPIEAVNVFEGPHEVRKIQNGLFSSVTTDAHRWPILVNGEVTWTTTANLPRTATIMHATPRIDAPEEPKWHDGFVQAVAWVWTEGHVDYTFGGQKRLHITQSETANPDKCRSIRGLLGHVFHGDFFEKKTAAGVVQFCLNVNPSAAILDVIGPDKAPTPDFLLSLTQAQLHLLINAAMAGDGTVDQATGVARWTQRSEHGLRQFEMACALAGIATNTRLKPGGAGHYGRDVSTVTLRRTTTSVPLRAIHERTGTRVLGTDEVQVLDAPVWCPTTPSHTWLARRNGSVYFTGNSHDWDTPTSKTLDAVELMPGDNRLPTKTRDGKAWPKEAGALLIKMQFNLETQRGKEAFSDVKFFGPDQEWSIGYNVPAGAASFERKSNTRNIKELELYEYSPVLFGAMPDAATRSVKSAQAAMKAVHHVMDDEDAANEDANNPREVAHEQDVAIEDDNGPRMAAHEDAPSASLTDDELQQMHDAAAEEISDEIDRHQQEAAEQETDDAVHNSDRREAGLASKADKPGHGGGNAQTLRDYWAHGKGAAKIRWGEDGDFDRCVAEVDKYMPGQAKGYCNLRHHDALGIYPATHAKLDREGHGDISDQAKSEFEDNFIPEQKDVSMSSGPGMDIGGVGTVLQQGNIEGRADSAQSETECPNCHRDDLVPRRTGGMGCPTCGYHQATEDTPFEDVGQARTPYDGALKSARHLPCPKCRSRKAEGDRCAECGAKLAPMFGKKSRMSASVARGPKGGAADVQVSADPSQMIDNDDRPAVRDQKMSLKPKDWLPCPNCRKNVPSQRTGKVVCDECGTSLARKTGADSEKTWSAHARQYALDNPSEKKEITTMTEPQFLTSALPGSMEDLQSRLTAATDEWARIASKSDEAWTTLEGTFPDFIQFTAYDEKSDQPRQSWQAGFTVNDDGTVDLDDPQAIDVPTMVVPSAVKALAGLSRVLESKGIDPSLLATALDRVADSTQGLDEIELMEFEAIKEFGIEGLESKSTVNPFSGGRSYADGSRQTGGSLPDNPTTRVAPASVRAGLGNARTVNPVSGGRSYGAGISQTPQVNHQGTVPAAPAERSIGKAKEGAEADTNSPSKITGGVGGGFTPQRRAAQMLASMHEEAKQDEPNPHAAMDHETASTYMRLTDQHLEVGNVGTARGHAERALSAHDRAMKGGESDTFGRVGGRAVATLRRFVKADDDQDGGEVTGGDTSGQRGHAGNIRGLEAAGGSKALEEKGKKSKAQEALFGGPTREAPHYIEDTMVDDTAAMLAEFEGMKNGL
ncbi:MAG: hypothetical protein NVS3B1_21410 [Marmoricola sp.]